VYAFIVVLCICLFASLAYAKFPRFEYHQIAQIGNKMGQTSLVDVNKDGDLDWIAGCNGGDIWWFEYKGPDSWVRHLLGQKAPTEVGGTAFDVDGDGWIDQVSGGAWYKNPGNPREQEFIKYPNDVIRRCHDNVAADIDGDGDNDVVRSNLWFENADGKATKWVEHKNIDFGQPGARFPLMTKTWVADLDKDGDNDVVQAEGDCISGRVAWHENTDSEGRKWTRHLIAGKTGQDFHSLAVADFDNDGDLDVFSGGGPLTKSPPHKWFIWENTDGKGRKWQQHIILSGKRCHEAKAADVDGDGDIDICSKPWNGSEHVYLRNMLKELSN